MVKNKESLKHQARNYSIKRGIFNSARTSFGERFFEPFAIAINTSSPMVALISSMKGLLGPISQLISYRSIENHKRKDVVYKFSLIEIFAWIPLILIALLFYKGLIPDYLPLILLLFIGMIIFADNATIPAWFSWMGDIVNKRNRGDFFSRRNILNNFVAAATAIIASFFLDYSKKQGWIIQGFIVLFVLAIISKTLTLKVIKKQYEPKIKFKKDKFCFFEFILSSPRTNFGKLAIYRMLFTFAGAVSSSLLAVYLLRYLNLSYSTYIIIILSGSFLSLFALKFWGIISDTYGNYQLISIASAILPLTSILWILSDNPFYLVFIPSTISGICWAGFHLAENNFIYDNIPKEKRGKAVAYYNMFWGAGMFFGGGLGAFLIKYLNFNFIEPIIAIFILSSFLKIGVVLWWIPKIKEIRKTEKFDVKDFVKKNLIRNGVHTINEEINQIRSIPHYLQI